MIPNYRLPTFSLSLLVLRLTVVEDSTDRRFLCRVDCELIIVLNLNPCSSIDASEAGQRRDPIGDIC